MKKTLILAIYLLVAVFTFCYLTFYHGYVYTAWNWTLAIPVNAFMAAIWPIYWAALHWLLISHEGPA